MVSINQRLASSILNVFTSPRDIFKETLTENILSIRKFIITPIEEQFEIPLALTLNFQNTVFRYSSGKEFLTKELVMGLNTDQVAINFRSADPIINSLFSESSRYLKKITTNKGVQYYGCNGIILDKDFLPLLFITFNGSFNYNEELYLNSIKYSHANVYIHPLVFVRESDLICKVIVKKIIPYLIAGLPEHFPYIINNGPRTKISRDFKVNIIIEDVTPRYIFTPDVKYIQEEGLNMRVANIDKYLDSI